MKQLNAFQENDIQEPFDFIVENAEMPKEIEYKKFKDENQVDIFAGGKFADSIKYPDGTEGKLNKDVFII